MNTFLHEGRRITFSNTGSLIASGSVVVILQGAHGFIGVAVKDIPATTGAEEVEIRGVHTLAAVTTDVANQGDIAYWDATQSKITVTKAGNTRAGRFETAKTNGQTTANILLNADAVGGLVGAQIVASTGAGTSSVAEVAVDQSVTIKANTMKAGDVYRIRGQIIATATHATDTLTGKLRIGPAVLTGLLIASSGALDVANNDIVTFDAEITIRTIGNAAAGTLVAMGSVSIGPPGTTLKSFNLASSAIDTTVDNLVGMTVQWSVSDPGNSARSDILTVEKL